MTAQIVVREIEQSDLQKGFFKTLSEFRRISYAQPYKVMQTLFNIKSNPLHKIFVAIRKEMVVGCITVIVEPKFIHDCGSVAHIEDLVVKKKFRGQHISEQLFEKALQFAKESQCYKVILDCNDAIKPLWIKYGFSAYENTMRLNL